LETNNRLNLKIGLSFNESEAWVQLQKQVANLQKKMDGYVNSTNNASKATDKTSKKVKEQATLMQKLGTEIKKTAKGFLAFTLVGGTILAVTTQIRRAVELMVDLDTAFTNFRIVTKATAEEVAQVDARVNELTVSLGALKKEIVDAVTEFARAGFSISDSLLLAENAIKGANVGATDLAKVTTFLIAGLKSFKLEAEDSARILDVLLKVANTTAINLEGIGDAFLRSANTLQTAGATLEQSASLIAGANESIQDPAKVGTALKTIASRLRGIGDEGEVIPTLAKDFKQIGIDIQNADGSFRNIYDIFKDFADVYGTLDDLTKESLLEKIAGKRQKNILIGLIENFDTVESSLENALNSAGEVAQANEKYLDSLAGRLKTLTAEWQKFTQTLSNSDLTKIAIQGITGVVKVLQLLAENLKTVSLLLGTAGIVGSISASVGALTLLGASIKTITLLTNPLFFVLSSAITTLGIVAIASTSELDTLEKAITKVTSKVNELNSQIDTLSNKKDITESELRYIELLKEQLVYEQEILEVQKQRQAELNLQETEKQLKKVNDVLKNQLDIQNGVNKAIFTEEGGEYSLVPNIDRDLNQLDKLQEELIGLRRDLLETGDTASIALVDNALAKISARYKELGVILPDVTSKVNILSTASEEQLSILEKAQQVISEVASEQELLRQAYQNLTNEGYIGVDLIEQLIASNTEYTSLLGLEKEAQLTLVDAFLSSNKNRIASEISTTDAIIKSVNSRIDALTAESKALIAKMKIESLAYSGEDVINEKRIARIDEAISKANLYVSNLTNANGLLKESLKEASDYGLDTKKTTESINEPLTEQERILRGINDQIELYNLQVKEAEGQERIDLQDKLIASYKLLKTEIDNQIASQQELLNTESNKLAILEATKDSSESNMNAYKKQQNLVDDLVDSIQDSNVAYETANNNLIDLTQSIYEANKAIEDQSKEMLRNQLLASIKEQTELIEKAIQKEIDANGDRLDNLKEEYDLRKDILDEKKNEYDFDKKIAELDKSIAEKRLEYAKLEKDNSLESQARKAELLEEIGEIEVDKTEEIIDENFRLEEKALDDSYESEKDRIESKIKLQEDALDKLQESSTSTLDAINNASELELNSLYDAFSSYIADSSSLLENGLGNTWDELISKVSTYNELLTGTESKINTSSDLGEKQASTTKSASYWKTQTSTDKPVQASIDALRKGGLTSEREDAIVNWLNTKASGGFSSSLSGQSVQAQTTPKLNTSSASSSVGSLVTIQNQNNIISDKYDVQNMSKDLTKGATKNLSNSGIVL